MAIDKNTFSIVNFQQKDKYALHSDDKTAHLTFDYAVWVNTGGRENRLGFYEDGNMRYSILRECIDASEEKIQEILLD